jgi:hypothetical protein
MNPSKFESQKDSMLALEHLRNGNIFISRSSVEDKMCEQQGYKFLGVSKLVESGGEVHIFRVAKLKPYRKHMEQS